MHFGSITSTNFTTESACTLLENLTELASSIVIQLLCISVGIGGCPSPGVRVYGSLDSSRALAATILPPVHCDVASWTKTILIWAFHPNAASPG